MTIKQTIGVKLDGTPGPAIIWKQTDNGYEVVADSAPAEPSLLSPSAIKILLSELPEDRSDHSMFTLVSSSGAGSHSSFIST